MHLLPAWLLQHRFSYSAEKPDPSLLDDLKTRLSKFQVEDPEVTIAIPAYNEERTILNTLSSLANQKTRFRTELIIANNNSKDRTQALLDACGVKSILVTQQGIGHARQAGLEAARGKYLLNADCDCIYPPTWVDSLVEPLTTPEFSCTYGTYSFLPSAVNSRAALMLHETVSHAGFKLRRWKGFEYINVLGFNFAFRRSDGLDVGGFRVDAGHQGTVAAQGVCEDGWMAMTLLDKGKLKHVTKGAHVWTDDRVLNRDGGVLKAFKKRIAVEFRRLAQK
ncbi:glycosyltransferase family 2 protein [Siphonobacter sp. SORGH_AS_0500]|uniref:glycosyltransferase family 2 protein n=1 Tax=Siphonobacter sp. SORGH_AS_0500 TaxID=1864824 RepID=UPI00285BD6F4|nr:glycosyltransferase family 2 protein [Siphonobacter sp. SORGH_AS_0500]MDR6193036.1 glycosyltransferase involved in cell wall biosynthesis [Siphonobacter sp. SORGH_AS_0500]